MASWGNRNKISTKTQKEHNQSFYLMIGSKENKLGGFLKNKKGKYK
jgi:hypothetical protein